MDKAERQAEQNTQQHHACLKSQAAHAAPSLSPREVAMLAAYRAANAATRTRVLNMLLQSQA